MTESAGTAWVKSIAVRNLRNINSETVHLSPFTVIVGQNGSGKSSLVDSFRFLSEAVQYTPALATQSQGGRRYLFRLFSSALKNAPLGMSVTLNRLPGTAVERALYEFDLSAEDESLVKREHLAIRHRIKVGTRRFISTKQYTINSGEWDSDGNFGFRPEGRYEAGTLQSRLALSFVAQDSLAKPVYDFLSRIHVVRPDARAIRSGWGRTAEAATISGEEISAVLARLRLRAHPSYRRIMDSFQEAVPYVLDLIKRRTEEGMPRLGEADSKVSLPLPSFSDGTLRALSLITGLFRDDRPALLVIDEVEDGLHPGAVEAIIRLIREEAIPAGKQVVLTTHNPYVLDLASARKMPNPASVVVARRGNRGQATFTPAGPAFERLLNEYQGSAGDYWLHGGFADFPDMLTQVEGPEEEPDAEN